MDVGPGGDLAVGAHLKEHNERGLKPFFVFVFLTHPRVCERHTTEETEAGACREGGSEKRSLKIQKF